MIHGLCFPWLPQVPYLVPLPAKHTLPVKCPFRLSASAFGDLRDDNLQLIIQVCVRVCV